MVPPGEIAFVALWTKDLPKQRRFFVEVMGFDVRQETPQALVLGAGVSTTVVLQHAFGATAHLDGETHIGYFVEDLGPWIERLRRAGALVLGEPTDVGNGHQAIVARTPGGQHFALVGM